MRIVSQLVPGGQPISTDIEGARKPGRNIWEIPSWGHPLALGVYPFFVSTNQRLIPVGTAFCISKLGVCITALHNVREVVQRAWRVESGFQSNTSRTHRAEKRIGMAVFHHQAHSGRRFSGRILGSDGLEEVRPTDICYVFPQFQEEVPYLPLPLSFAVPSIDSRVVCVGFGSPAVQEEGFSLHDAQCGRLNLLDMYGHKLTAVEAHVTRIFTQRFAPGFIGGPCYTIDAETEENMTGGPVFSEGGYVCGIISGRATNFFGQPASTVSMLYPVISAKVRFEGQLGGMRINSNLRLIDLIAQGSVTTDGSEHQLRKTPRGGDLSLSLRLWRVFGYSEKASHRPEAERSGVKGKRA
jgi:hypothetical protein